MLWREKHLLEIIKAGKLNTTEVVERADMSKATALKYLEGLKGMGLVKCEMIGPTKLWSLALTREEEVKVETEGKGFTYEQKKVEECISVDRRIFKLLDKFERVTGNRLGISINKTGIKLNMQGGSKVK